MAEDKKKKDKKDKDKKEDKKDKDKKEDKKDKDKKEDKKEDKKKSRKSVAEKEDKNKDKKEKKEEPAEDPEEEPEEESPKKKDKKDKKDKKGKKSEKVEEPAEADPDAEEVLAPAELEADPADSAEPEPEAEEPASPKPPADPPTPKAPTEPPAPAPPPSVLAPVPQPPPRSPPRGGTAMNPQSLLPQTLNPVQDLAYAGPSAPRQGGWTTGPLEQEPAPMQHNLPSAEVEALLGNASADHVAATNLTDTANQHQLQGRASTSTNGEVGPTLVYPVEYNQSPNRAAPSIIGQPGILPKPRDGEPSPASAPAMAPGPAPVPYAPSPAPYQAPPAAPHHARQNNCCMMFAMVAVGLLLLLLHDFLFLLGAAYFTRTDWLDGIVGGHWDHNHHYHGHSWSGDASLGGLLAASPGTDAAVLKSTNATQNLVLATSAASQGVEVRDQSGASRIHVGGDGAVDISSGGSQQALSMTSTGATSISSATNMGLSATGDLVLTRGAGGGAPNTAGNWSGIELNAGGGIEVQSAAGGHIVLAVPSASQAGPGAGTGRRRSLLTHTDTDSDDDDEDAVMTGVERELADAVLLGDGVQVSTPHDVGVQGHFVGLRAAQSMAFEAADSIGIKAEAAIGLTAAAAEGTVFLGVGQSAVEGSEEGAPSAAVMLSNGDATLLAERALALVSQDILSLTSSGGILLNAGDADITLSAKRVHMDAVVSAPETSIGGPGGSLDLDFAGAGSINGVELSTVAGSDLDIFSGADVRLTATGGLSVFSAANSSVTTEDFALSAHAFSLLGAGGASTVRVQADSTEDHLTLAVQSRDALGAVVERAVELRLHSDGSGPTALHLAAHHSSGGIAFTAGSAGLVANTTGPASVRAAKGLSLEAEEAFTLRGAGTSLISSSASANGQDLTVQVVGNTDSSLRLESEGTGIDAVHIQSKSVTGGVFIKAGTQGGQQCTVVGTQLGQQSTYCTQPRASEGQLYMQAGTGGVVMDTTGSLTMATHGSGVVHLVTSSYGQGAVMVETNHFQVDSNYTDHTAQEELHLEAAGAGEEAVALRSRRGGMIISAGVEEYTPPLYDSAGGEGTFQLVEPAQLVHGRGHLLVESGTGGTLLDSTGGINITTLKPEHETSAVVQPITLSSGAAGLGAIRLETSDSSGGILLSAGSSGLDLRSSGKLQVDAAGNVEVTSSAGEVEVTAAGGLLARASGSAGVSLVASTGPVALTAQGSSTLQMGGSQGTLLTSSGSDITLSATGAGGDVTLSALDRVMVSSGNDISLASTLGDLLFTADRHVHTARQGIELKSTSAADPIKVVSTNLVTIDASLGIDIGGVTNVGATYKTPYVNVGKTNTKEVYIGGASAGKVALDGASVLVDGRVVSVGGSTTSDVTVSGSNIALGSEEDTTVSAGDTLRVVGEKGATVDSSDGYAAFGTETAHSVGVGNAKAHLSFYGLDVGMEVEGVLEIGGGGAPLAALKREGGAARMGIGVDAPAYPLHLASGAHCTAGGVWTDASSRALKEGIVALQADRALETLDHLQPVRFRYKAEEGAEYMGFIAEDVPEEVASGDRSGLSPMNFVAVLTRVVQQQKAQIANLEAALQQLQDIVASRSAN